MITRRRVLSILAGAAALPVAGASAAGGPVQWRGIALGAQAQIILDHPNAKSLISSAVEEIRRLEQIFSLYQSESQISRLNRDGILRNPAFELIELLSLCSTLHSQTSGAFDPTIQNFWSLYAKAHSTGSKPGHDALTEALEKTGWGLVQFSASQIGFATRGVQITLNGIAQGYIADRISAQFRRAGVHDVLVNTGEISALGSAPDGNNWQVDIAGNGAKTLQLSDGAIATSSPLGTTLDSDGSVGHILDPRSGLVASGWSQVSVIDESAAVADGLSTAFCLMEKSDIESCRGAAQVILS